MEDEEQSNDRLIDKLKFSVLFCFVLFRAAVRKRKKMEIMTINNKSVKVQVVTNFTQ